jgi:ribosomal protein L3 glutamine methyltransferase
LIAVTVRDLIDAAHARFERARLVFGHGTTNARDEAVYLVLHALRLPPGRLTPFLSRPITAAEHRRTLRLIADRIRRRIPAAYLTREAWLGDDRFYVDRRVIVPRSYIAELLRERLAPWIARPTRVRRALDLCTGSGCLAIVLAKTFPTARVDAVDISRAALAVARRNVATYGLQERLRLLHGDLFSALPGERYDLIIANPPYVANRVMRKLPREYRHEPRLALAGGRDGFDLVRLILRQAAQHLTAAGLLVVEVGHHRERLETAFPHLPFVWPQTSGGEDCVFMLECRDLAGAAGAAAVAPRQASRARAASRRRSARNTGRV